MIPVFQPINQKIRAFLPAVGGNRTSVPEFSDIAINYPNLNQFSVRSSRPESISFFPI
jgi:hypothetical protein